MKINKIILSAAVAALLVSPSAVFAEDEEEAYQESTAEALGLEVSGEVIATYGVFTGNGVSNNPKRYDDGSAVKHVAGEPTRADISARLYVNGEIGEESSWHGELQFNKDLQGVDGYRSIRINSQYDWLRELYVDTNAGDMDLRIGKQQVVWGKADGMKFLDIINPTDVRHWGQDSMEDSRIPLWMLTAEYPVGENGSIQMVYVPQVNVTNQIPGLYNPETGDEGQPFVPLGMDTMVGQYNGFMSIGPQLGGTAAAFGQGLAAVGGLLGPFSTTTVQQFVAIPDVDAATGGAIPFPGSGEQMLAMTVNGVQQQMGYETNLYTSPLNTNNPKTMFDYMGDSSFATFDSFQGLNTKYIRNLEDNDFDNANIGFRYAGSTDGGLNYTFNYYYHYDNNPVIDVSWEGAQGQALTAVASGPNPTQDPNFQSVAMNLFDSQGVRYDSQGGANPVTMVFTESQNKINTFGTSFDYAIDNDFAPVILRGEFVYDKDTKQPVVDLSKLAYGDFTGAFTNQDADFFNYVIGLDVTVLTNLFVSFQFMDKWNLDYQDKDVQRDGNSRAYGVFTANPATMSLDNEFKKAEEHQIMYTFFLSKPFMESDVLRVNNLFLLENDNYGWWNRFDFEYSWSDSTILSAAWNQYGGDEYGVFGQFEDMSNVQASVKFIF